MGNVIRILRNKEDQFPDPLTTTRINGYLLALGEDLYIEHIRAAYRKGIFPWGMERYVLWCFTDPRMVLQTKNLIISHSLKKRLKKAISGFYNDDPIEIMVDHCTGEVIKNCSKPRNGSRDTWLAPKMIEMYTALAKEGFVHSIEVLVNHKLVGGLYGVNIGRMFYGESMFSRLTDTSKLALCALVALCKQEDIPWIDCQQETEHLASMGAAPLSGADFVEHLDLYCEQPAPDWSKYQNRNVCELCRNLL